MSKFTSRKLLATVGCVLLVAGADLIGAPLDQASMEAITNMLLGLVGAQGMVDTAGAWKAGKAVAKTAHAAKELVEDSK